MIASGVDGRSRFYLTTVALFCGSVLLYLLNIGHAPHPDELYHIIAAEGILSSGEPRIAEGLYERAYAHTWLIAQFFRLFGDSLIVARLPSVLAMSLVVVTLFLWLDQQVDRTTAWVGSVLFAVSPFAVEIAHSARFYGLQTMFFFAGSLGIFSLLEHRRRNHWHTAFITLFSVVTLASAVYLQATSLIGIVGLITWSIIRLCTPWLLSDLVLRRHKLMVIASLLVLGLLLCLAAYQLGYLEQALAMYRSSPLFNQSQSDNFLFYHIWMSLYYPSVWPAIGLLVLVAVIYRPVPAVFAAFVFLTSFTLNSFAAQKSLRYLIYAQPYFFILLGMGLTSFLPIARQGLKHLQNRLQTIMPIREQSANRVSTMLIGGALLVLLAGNPAWIRSAALLSGITIPPEKPPIDWVAVKPELLELIDNADIVVTMAELEVLYFYGTYDLLLSDSRLHEIPGALEFSADFRTGRPVIGSPEALSAVLNCFDEGLFITNKRRWGSSNLISKELTQLIVEHTSQVPLAPRSGVLAFSWNNDDASALPEECALVPPITRHRNSEGQPEHLVE